MRDVVGLDQAGDELGLALGGECDDAAGDCPVFVAECGAGLDGGVDLVEAAFELLGLGDRFVGPLVVVEIDELVMAVGEAGAFLGFVGRGLCRDGVYAAEAGKVLPSDVEPGFGPFPFGCNGVGHLLELLRGELVEQLRILEPDAVFLLVGEQVAVDDAARGLVGVDADEGGGGGLGGHAALGEHAADLPGAGSVALFGDLLPGGELAGGVGGGCEGLQAFEVDRFLAVCLEELGSGGAEAQALFDGALGDAEAGGDLRDRGSGPRQGHEGLDLVGGVHRRADDVFRERDFRLGGFGGNDAAGHGKVGGNLVLRGEVRESAVAAAAGDDREGVVGAVDRTDDEVGEDSERGDGCLELGEGLHAGVGLPHVAGGEFEAVEGDVLDSGFGLRIDGAHARLLAGEGSPRGVGPCGRFVPEGAIGTLREAGAQRWNGRWSVLGYRIGVGVGVAAMPCRGRRVRGCR